MVSMPATWTAEEFRGRADDGRTRPLRLKCSRASSASGETADFYVKGLGLPEISEQSLFGEIVGNVMARECGIATPDPAFIEIPSAFFALRDVAATGLHGERFAGSRSLGPGTGPAIFGHMTDDQVADVARIYAFDLCVQNPDRRRGNPNALIVGGRVVAFDFEACFSFLYPILGARSHPWELSRLGIGPTHVFRPALQTVSVDWHATVSSILAGSARTAQDLDAWLPTPWRQWAERVRGHMMDLASHEQELVFEIVRSLR